MDGLPQQPCDTQWYTPISLAGLGEGERTRPPCPSALTSTLTKPPPALLTCASGRGKTVSKCAPTSEAS